MRFGLIGNHSAPTTTESYVALALETLGHTVHRHQENTTNYPTLAQDLEDQECGVVFWTRTPSYRCDAAEQARFLDDAHARGIITCGLHLDRYWDLAREADIWSHPWFKQTHVMTADGGNDDRFAEAGVNHSWWKPAISATQCGAGVFTPEYATDVAFVGSDRYHPEWPWRHTLLHRLPRMYGHQFRQYGRSGERLEDHQLADAYASIKVVVGDSCLADRSDRYWSNRVVETLGRGGFLVHPRVKGMDEHYTEGEHLVYYDVNQPAQLRAVIDRWLDDEEGRHRIQAAGMERVMECDTFETRMAEVIGLLIEAHPHLKPWRDVLAAHARPNTSDRVVIREQFDEDTYRLEGAKLRGRRVVDVGANIGAFALNCAERGASVVAVEPDAGNVAVLEAVVKETGADVKVFAAAAADRARVGHVEGSDGTAQFVEGEGDVKAFPLDSWLDRPDIAILKIDVEGAEYDIVGAASLLARCERIEIEWHGKGMAAGADGGRVGELVAKLLQTHVVEVYGLPDVGGAIHAVRR